MVLAKNIAAMRSDGTYLSDGCVSSNLPNLEEKETRMIKKFPLKLFIKIDTFNLYILKIEMSPCFRVSILDKMKL